MTFLLSESEIESWLNCGALISYENDKIMVGWGKCEWRASPEGEELGWFYFPNYFLNSEMPWLYFEKSAITSVFTLLRLLEKSTNPVDECKSISPLDWSIPSKSEFSDQFDKLKKKFDSKELEKVVLYAFSKSSQPLYPLQHQQALMNLMRYKQKSRIYIYGFWLESEGILGATPEVLFQLESDDPDLKLFTMALAGTQKSESNADDMLINKKLLHEHMVVVDNIAAKLAPFGEIRLGELQVLSLPTLAHLLTPITAQLNQKQEFLTLVNILHPTPALGGVPENIATQWLSSYDKIIPRGRFGAPVGFYDLRNHLSTCYVAIRNIMWDQNGCMIGAGCGLVTESDMEIEWAELLLKLKSIMIFLGL